MPVWPAARAITVGTFTPFVPNTSTICYGCSTGPLSVAQAVSILKPNRLRIYNNAVSTNLPQLVSTKLGGAAQLIALSNKASSGYAAAVAAGKAICNGFADHAPLGGLQDEVCLWHEPYDEIQGGNFTAAQYAAAQVNWKNDVVIPVNATRTNKLLNVPIVQGFVLLQNRAVLDQIYTPAVIAVADILGTDNYQGNQQAPWAAYAKSKGKPWGIYEWGWIAGSTTSQANDTTAFNFMTANQPGLAALDPPPVDVLWFNNNGTLITGLPTTRAQTEWARISSS